ncbi:hypothetical protein K1719_001322 [Acacia pycnantha]|nr:hypothetical protein K1719_001322 [Acacia pycnantha]
MAQPTSEAPDLNQQPAQPQQQWTQPHQYQQWMNMQYPASAMAMMQQQMMMYPPHYIPYVHQYYQPPYHHPHLKQPPTQPPHHQQSSNDEIKTIWLGDLHHWMDENYLNSCFAHTGEVYSVKVIRNKQTGQSEGYGFVEFYTRATAEKVLQSYHDVTDTMLQETFASRYSSFKGAKVVIDSSTGRSKGYGFVRFADENERSRALTEMNGQYCSSRPMRISIATPKKSYGHQQHYSSQAVVLANGYSSNGAMAQGSLSEGDSLNTTIFVGGLDSDISDEDLRQPFLQYGDVVSVKIPVGKGCGFVQFANRKNAEEAIEALNGIVIGKQTVRLSWGRSPGNKHWRSDSNGGQHGGQGYGARQHQA